MNKHHVTVQVCVSWLWCCEADEKSTQHPKLSTHWWARRRDGNVPSPFVVASITLPYSLSLSFSFLFLLSLWQRNMKRCVCDMFAGWKVLLRNIFFQRFFSHVFRFNSLMFVASTKTEKMKRCDKRCRCTTNGITWDEIEIEKQRKTAENQCKSKFLFSARIENFDWNIAFDTEVIRKDFQFVCCRFIYSNGFACDRWHQVAIVMQSQFVVALFYQNVV